MSELKTLNDWAPFIEGQQFLGRAKKHITCSKQVLEDFLTMLEEDETAKVTFETVEIATDFYDICTDFKHFIPKDQRVEVFYAAKNGGVIYRNIPSFCVFMLRKCWSHCNGISNLIIKTLPAKCLKEFCTQGYFGGDFTLRDAICNICDPDYTPVSLAHPRCKHERFVEFYIAQEDMVAALPPSIADILTDTSTTEITSTVAGLSVGGVLLRTMAGHVGAINSTYDLRELL